MRFGHRGSSDQQLEGAELEEARLARQTTAALAGLLAEREMSRSQLAESLGVSQGRVSQILSGGENLTLRSLAGIARALDARVEVQFLDVPGAGQSSTARPSAPQPAPSVPTHF